MHNGFDFSAKVMKKVHHRFTDIKILNSLLIFFKKIQQILYTLVFTN